MTAYSPSYARHYDLLYADKDYVSEAGYARDLLERFKLGGDRLLEFGSGTGRHAAVLAGMGFSVHGVEQSAAMLRAAREAIVPGCEFSEGDLRQVRLGRKFDAVLALFNVIGYQTSNDDLAAAFASARLHLDTGGLLLFDYWYGPAVLHQRPSVRIKRASDDTVDVTRLTEPELLPNEDTVVVNFHIFARDKGTASVSEYREQHRVRYLFLPEIEYLLARQGMRLEHSEEWLTGRPLGLETWYGISVARAV